MQESVNLFQSAGMFLNASTYMRAHVCVCVQVEVGLVSRGQMWRK